MSLFDPKELAAILGANAAAATAKPERKQSLIWINVGITLQGSDGKPVFVSLGGLPLDSIEPIEIKSNAKPEWRHLAEAKNALLKMVKDGVVDLASGEARDLGLSTQVYKRAEAETTVSTDNPLTAQLAALTSAKPTAAAAPAAAGVTG